MSVKEINPNETTRAYAFKYWMKAPNPMVTIFKTFDVMPLVINSNTTGRKFNMLLDYCIGKAASTIKEFYLLPVGNKLMLYDKIAVNAIIKNKNGELNSCDIVYTSDLKKFNEDYLHYTKQVYDNCCDCDLSKEYMVIGTSAIIDTEIDGVVGMNSGIFNNPFLIWGKYKINEDKALLSISFQFHHTQLDGAHAGKFLKNLEEIIKNF